jgi:hypothetical protein
MASSLVLCCCRPPFGVYVCVCVGLNHCVSFFFYIVCIVLFLCFRVSPRVVLSLRFFSLPLHVIANNSKGKYNNNCTGSASVYRLALQRSGRCSQCVC